MRIISREEWGAKHDDGAGPAPLPAREVWLHHSATTPPKDATEVRAMRALEQIGEDRFGRGVSYTFAIPPSGRVYQGHSIDRRGAHTKGRNSIARAIVLMGDYSKTPPSEAQVRAVRELLAHGRTQGWWAGGLTGGHRDAPKAATSCPGDAAWAFLARFNATGPRPTVLEDAMTRLWLDPTDSRTQWAVSAHGMTRLPNMAEVERQQRLGLLPPGRPEKVTVEDFTAHKTLAGRVLDGWRRGLATEDTVNVLTQTIGVLEPDVTDLRGRIEALEQTPADPRVDELATATADLDARLTHLEKG